MRMVLTTMLLFWVWGCKEGRIANGYEQEKAARIATIREASGICYISRSDTFFVVGDNGMVYHLDREGKILSYRDFSWRKHKDFEGITYDAANDLLYIAVEGVDNLLVIDRGYEVHEEIDIDRKDRDGNLILEKENKTGIEAVALTDAGLYVANQSYTFLPDEDPSVLIKVQIESDSATLEEIVSLAPYVDIAGLDYFQNSLYMVSDDEKLLLRYDLQNGEIVEKRALRTFDPALEDKAIEGVAFDDDGNIYFAYDDKKNGRIFRYRFTP